LQSFHIEINALLQLFNKDGVFFVGKVNSPFAHVKFLMSLILIYLKHPSFSCFKLLAMMQVALNLFSWCCVALYNDVNLLHLH